MSVTHAAGKMVPVNREAVSTPDAPAAIGPYSQAIRANGLIFVSGQTPLSPGGEVERGAISAQAAQCLRNLAAILEAAGSGMDRVVKTTVFLSDMAHFAEMNAVYKEHFGDTPPARSTVAVAGLPLGIDVEIEAIALA